jgi:hypothetical protein
LGGGVAVGTEFVDDRIYGEEILTKLVPMKIMSEIPTIRTTQEQKQQMVSLATLLVATVLIVVSIAIGSAYTFFRG